MAMAGEMGLDEERVFRRIGFLKDRAQAHQEQAGERHTMHVACAGALLRDAAASAMLVGEFASAGELLVKAGELWAGLGLFAGYALIAIAKPEALWTDRGYELSELLDSLGVAERMGATREHHPDRAPMMDGSAASSRQLLHLYQAVRPRIGEHDLVSLLIGMSRSRLVEGSTAQVGPTESPVRAYVHLLDATVDGDFDRAARDTLAGMVLRRVEQLESARADEYHWRRVLAPAALVDFDMLSLAMASIDSRGTAAELAEHLADREPAARLPLEVARAMRPETPSGFHDGSFF